MYICRLWKDEPENKEIQMECLMDAQTKKQKERQMDEQADGQTKGWTGERQMEGQTDLWQVGGKYSLTNRYSDGWRYGWRDQGWEFAPTYIVQ